MILSGGLAEQLQQQVVAPASSWWMVVWEFVNEQLAILPPWARLVLVLFVVLSFIATRWWLPALANYVRAKRSGGGGA